MEQGRAKILYVITKSNFGGAQKYVYDLATRLPEEKFDVAVALGGTGEKGAGEGELAKRLREADVHTIFVKAFARDIRLLAECRALFELFRIMRREKPAAVHLNSSKAGALGALAARLAGIKKIIFTVHGLPEGERRGAFARALIRLATRITFALCTDIIAISNYDLGLIRNRKAHLIYNGARPIEFLPRENARESIVPPDIARRHEEYLWVGTSAELHPNKNLFTAIEAIARCNESPHQKIFYVVMGEGELREKLEAAIAGRRMREEIFLAGFVPDAAACLKAFDIFFLPSRKEGLPYALLEAGAAELPVVASKVGGIPELIEDGANGFLCNPDDAGGFAQALEKLRDEELRRRLGEELMLRVKKNFSFERMLEQTAALY